MRRPGEETGIEEIFKAIMNEDFFKLVSVIKQLI
jgi:hypothetical protein